MSSQKSRSKNGIKRAWCNKKLQKLFTVLTSSNNARVETTSKTLQLNKASIFCSTVLLIIVAARPASAITPVIMVGHNASDTVAKAEKACTFFCQLALKFTGTKEGRTAMVWLAWMGVTKAAQVTSMVAVFNFGMALLTIAFICTTAYGIETIIGPDTFIGADFLNYANK